MPEIYLYRSPDVFHGERGSNEQYYIERPRGLIADLPDISGTYSTLTGEDITIDMSQAFGTNPRRVAIECDLFIGHERSAGYVGKSRRVIDLSKKGVGSQKLSVYERLTVMLKTSTP